MHLKFPKGYSSIFSTIEFGNQLNLFYQKYQSQELKNLYAIKNNVVWLGGIEVNWILKSGLLAISTIYIVVTITFFLIRLMTGNIVDMLIITYMLDYGMTR